MAYSQASFPRPSNLYKVLQDYKNLDWVFLKLEYDTFWIDPERYFLNDSSRILGIFHFIVYQAKQMQLYV